MDFNPEEIELRQIATQPEIYALEVTVNDILSKWKVNEDLKKQYFAFGRELLKIKKKFHPKVWERPIDYRDAVREVATEWNRKKLNKEILKDIARAMGVSAIVEFLS